MSNGRVPPAAEDLVTTAQLLWPPPASAALVRGADVDPTCRVVREFAFLPSAKRPRLVVPIGVPAAAAAAVRRYSQALSDPERYARAALALVLRSGLGERLLSDRVRISIPDGDDSGSRSVEDVLGDALGEQVVVSLGLGNRRANQKPILHVLTPAGKTRAFVKVGNNDMARALVRGEADVLLRVAALPLTRITPPRVLGLISWNELDLLVLSPLTNSAKRGGLAGDEPPYAAITELAGAAGIESGPLASSPYWRRIKASVAKVHDPEVAALLGTVVEAVERRHGRTVFRYGSWHGDFTPWNLQRRGETIALWDWERFAVGVPLGFDALHYRQALDSARLGDANAATQRLAQHAAANLARVGVPAELAGATCTLYLLELCSRFLLAAQEETGEPLRARARWLLDHLAQFEELA
jgi:hypothetical protein